MSSTCLSNDALNQCTEGDISSGKPCCPVTLWLLGPCLKMGWLGWRHHCRPPVALGVLRILHPCGQLQWEWEGPAPLLGGGERMQRLLAPRPWKGGGRCDIHDLEPVGLHPHWQTVKQRRKSCFSCLHINTKNGISGAGVYKKLHL